ncbi:hypothetical protein OIU78_012435 [Salix suchowensis]|nr:hypothetical protein OIU78_012435 [Salix suchowensis]
MGRAHETDSESTLVVLCEELALPQPEKSPLAAQQTQAFGRPMKFPLRKMRLRCFRGPLDVSHARVSQQQI